MSKELKEIWRHSRVYGLGRLLDRLSALCLIPVLVHVLPPVEWGIYLLVLVVMELVAIAPGGLLQAMVRLYFDHDRSVHRREVIGTTLVLLAAIACLLVALAWPLAQVATALIGVDPSYLTAFAIGVVTIVFNLLLELDLNICRVRKQSAIFMCASLARSLLQFGLSIFFVVAWDFGVLGVIFGHLIAAVSVSLLITAVILRREGFAFSAAVAREIVRIGLPLAPAGLGRSALTLIERFLIHAVAGTAALGVYGLGSRLAEQLRILMVGPFSDIWQVRLMELSSKPRSRAEFHRVQVFFLALLAAAALGLSVFSVEIVMVIADQSYWQAAMIVPLLALGQLVRPVSYFFQSALLERKKTGCLPIIDWATVVVGAGALYLLIPIYGMLGAAVAMLIAYSCRLVGSVWFAARYTDFARLFPWGSYLGILALAIAFFGLTMAIAGSQVTLSAVALKGLILLGFPLALYLGPIFTLSERALMRQQVQKVVKGISGATLGR